MAARFRLVNYYNLPSHILHILHSLDRSLRRQACPSLTAAQIFDEGLTAKKSSTIKHILTFYHAFTMHLPCIFCLGWFTIALRLYGVYGYSAVFLRFSPFYAQPRDTDPDVETGAEACFCWWIHQKQQNWLVVWKIWIIFPNSWDDDPIWRTPSFFRGVGSNHQWENCLMMADGRKLLAHLKMWKTCIRYCPRNRRFWRFEDVSVQESLLPEYSSYEQLDEMHWEVGSCWVNQVDFYPIPYSFLEHNSWDRFQGHFINDFFFESHEFLDIIFSDAHFRGAPVNQPMVSIKNLQLDPSKVDFIWQLFLEHSRNPQTLQVPVQWVSKPSHHLSSSSSPSRFLCERMQQRMANLQEALRQLEEEAGEAVEDTTRLEPAVVKVCVFFCDHLSSEIIPKIGDLNWHNHNGWFIQWN